MPSSERRTRLAMNRALGYDGPETGPGRRTSALTLVNGSRDWYYVF